MKKIITKSKPKLKIKPKSKPKPKDKSKINKQNQNVKVSIKIGTDGKTINQQQPSSNAITNYPIFQDAPRPVNIINNHENRERIAPIHIPTVPIQNHIQPIEPIRNPVPTHTTPIHINRLKTIRKPRKSKSRNVKIFDEIPDFIDPGYGSGGSINYATPIDKFSFTNPLHDNPGRLLGKRNEPPIPFSGNDLLVAKRKLIITPAKAYPGATVKVLNPVTNRLISVDGSVYLRLAKNNGGTFPTN